MDVSANIRKLIGLSKQKYKLLKQIDALTLKQTKYLKERDLKAVQRVISEKQEKMHAVDLLDKDFQQTFDKMKAALGVGSLDELSGKKLPGADILSDIIKKIISLVKDIQSKEKKNYDIAKEDLNYFRDKVKGVNVGKKAVSAYHPKPYKIPSYFIDKKK